MIDIVASATGLIALLPLILLITVIVMIPNNGKPFFTQRRAGKNENVFRILKFKTMNDRKDNSGNLLPPEQRITPIGRILRKTSLDELPQLLNVLAGDMSLVGPRPLPTDYLPLYNETQRKRHSVKPGITGWAQVNGRNTLTWNEKFQYDVLYADNISFSFDVRIMMLTVKKVLLGEGVNYGKQTTIGRFNGKN
jgi:lipopolysaccharide/colanic/teichoic acid biosynthesis glycosyltransferase